MDSGAALPGYVVHPGDIHLPLGPRVTADPSGLAGGKYSVYRWGGGLRGAQSRRRKSRLSGCSHGQPSTRGLRDHPLVRELQARNAPTEPYAVFRSETELADTPWILLDICDHGIILFDPRSVLARKLASLRLRLS